MRPNSFSPENCASHFRQSHVAALATSSLILWLALSCLISSSISFIVITPSVCVSQRQCHEYVNGRIGQCIPLGRRRCRHTLPRQGAQMGGGHGHVVSVVPPMPVVTVQAAFAIVVHDLGDYFECVGRRYQP